MKIALHILLALIALAGNSILCRLALGEDAIDAASFTSIRLLSGIIVLVIIMMATQSKSGIITKGSWKASIMLFLYAITFSYAYISLETGVGALILFGSVQITMIVAGLLLGNRLHQFEWLGVIVAFSGFVYLVMPGVTAPSFIGFILMAIAGIAWGGYTLVGKGSVNPLCDTTFNFVRTLPLLVILIAVTFEQSVLSQKGIILAILSGGVTSGIGYTIWYTVLRELTAIQAAVIQLLVPVLAAFGGVLFVGEVFTFRLVVSSIMILLGVLAVILGRYYLEKNLEKNLDKG